MIPGAIARLTIAVRRDFNFDHRYRIIAPDRPRVVEVVGSVRMHYAAGTLMLDIFQIESENVSRGYFADKYGWAFLPSEICQLEEERLIRMNHAR